MDCINLQKQFGTRYRITFDAAYDSRNRPGDDFLAVTFDVADFDAVAHIVEPRRKRTMSAANRERKRLLMIRFNQQSTLPTQVNGAPSHADASA